MVLYHLLLDEVPQGAPRVQQREYVKVSPKSEDPERLSPSTDVNAVRVGEHRNRSGPHCLPFLVPVSQPQMYISALVIGNSDS